MDEGVPACAMMPGTSREGVPGGRSGLSPWNTGDKRPVAEWLRTWISDWARRGRLRDAAYVFVVCCLYLLLASDPDSGLLRNGATSMATSAATYPAAAAATWSVDGIGLWAAAGHQRRRSLKPAACRWLLLIFLLSGDVESNPGPALRAMFYYVKIFDRNR